MFNALVLYRAEQVGGMLEYAKKLDVAKSTLWRWNNGYVDVFDGNQGEAKQRFFDDLGMPKEDLQRLSEISVTEAVQLILEVPETSPTGKP